MTRRFRSIMFFAGAGAIAFFLLIAFVHLPGPSGLRSRYLQAINSKAFAQRNTTDAVTAVNFDYRAFDTLGEEFILFSSVMGALVLLRQAGQKLGTEIRDAISPGREVGAGDATRLWILAMVCPKILFGIYIVTHGQLTPGGGFQGGVILASAALIIYLGEDFRVFQKIMTRPLIEISEAVGAGLFVVIGLSAMFAGLPLFTNDLPMGKSHVLTSAGTIPLISLVTGLEVTAGFVLLLDGFLQETLCRESKPREP